MASHFAEPFQDRSYGMEFASSFKPDEDPTYDEPNFKQALDGTPTSYSDKALALLIFYKCFYESNGISTCDGIYSAFKQFWAEV
jgi:hypothetical protein